MFDTDDGLSLSLNFWDQFINSQSQSYNMIPIFKVSISLWKIETGYTALILKLSLNMQKLVLHILD